MKKIKWLNVIKLIILLGCVGVVLHDMYMLTLHSWVTGQLVGWTWLGFITFIMAICIGGAIYEDFEEQTKKVPNTRTV